MAAAAAAELFENSSKVSAAAFPRPDRKLDDRK
jgi:hypothetical protein